jgi:hypothetical protein
VNDHDHEYNDPVMGSEKDREDRVFINSFYMRTNVPPNTTDADTTEATTKPSSPKKSPADALLFALFPFGWGDPAPPDWLLAGKPEIEGSYSLGRVLLDTPFQQYWVKHALH